MDNKILNKIKRLYPRHFGEPMCISINEMFKPGTGWESNCDIRYYFTKRDLIKLKSLKYTKVNLHLFIDYDQQYFPDFSIDELLN